MEFDEKIKRKANPREKSNIFSILSFFYTIPLFKQGIKRDIQEKDIYEILSNYQTTKLGDRIENEWHKQKSENHNQSIVRLLWTCYGWQYFSLGLFQLFFKTVNVVFQPRALGKLISYFVPGQTSLTRNDAIFYASLVIGLNLFNSVCMHNYEVMILGLTLRVRSAFSSLLYRKSLKLSPEKLGDISIGKIVTLITKDISSIEIFIQFANDIWIGLIQTVVITAIIYSKIGVAGLAGVGFFLLIMPLQFYIGSCAAKSRLKMCKTTDNRLQLTQEILSAMKIIKIYTWEKFFAKKVSKYREKELSIMNRIFYLKIATMATGSLNSKIAFYLVIMTYIWLGNIITAEIVYFLLSCFQNLNVTMSYLFPLGVSSFAELFSALKRLGNVLKALELSSEDSLKEIGFVKPKILIKNVSINFKEKKILNNINLNLDHGLIIITGLVGSGKSVLLKTILKDFKYNEGGALEVFGITSYASQEPWLFPATIKQNILFGANFNEARYNKVLDVCALRFDLDLLPNGDATIVEDRGINLSKGQQSRINLARAVYRDADIYLLDDCLAALDAHVSDFIFKECIVNFLSNKLVLLVTHSINHSNAGDKIVVLNGGTIESVKKCTDLDKQDIIKAFAEKEKKEFETMKSVMDDDKKNENEKLLAEGNTGRRVYGEAKEEGAVMFKVYKKYLSFGGGCFVFFLIFVVFAIAQIVHSYTDKLVSSWVNIEQTISNLTIHNATESDGYHDSILSRDKMLTLYTIMIVSYALLSFLRAFVLIKFTWSASKNLHKYMVSHIVNATMHFFDSNFVGNILNRFSKDLSCIDEVMPWLFFQFIAILLITGGIVTLIALVNITFLIPTAIFFLFLATIRKYYLPTSRSLKRLDASTKSPVVGHLNATLEGLTTVRAFKAEEILKHEFDRHQDLNTSTCFSLISGNQAFTFALDLLCTLYIGLIVGKFLLFKNDFLAGSVGLAITQAFQMTGTLQWGIRQWAEIENNMTSVERVLEYTEMKQENHQGLEIESWPKYGEVRYENVYLTYPNAFESVLKNINFTAKPQQKIGIVGRTGAGKSTIITTLFRLYEVNGKITIDGVDTKTISLAYLRSKISIIPQDPVLFTGSIRSNIDPNQKYTDDEIWRAITQSHLKDIIPSLDFGITENGSNFSVGQRQLICMARAIIRNNKIIVLDEATANMDRQTDEMIYQTIRNNFAHCTVFTIAHKLNSILDSDKVLVMEKGEIIEFDTPGILLENTNGAFYKMVEKAGLLPTQ